MRFNSNPIPDCQRPDISKTTAAGKKLSGKEIIEEELFRLTAAAPSEVGLFGMSYEESFAYQIGLIAAYQHALEMWEEE